MNAGMKYLMDSIVGLMMEVANLRTIVELRDARIAELSQPVPEDGGHQGLSPTATVGLTGIQETP